MLRAGASVGKEVGQHGPEAGCRGFESHHPLQRAETGPTRQDAHPTHCTPLLSFDESASGSFPSFFFEGLLKAGRIIHVGGNWIAQASRVSSF